jgi:hypothetical protein
MTEPTHSEIISQVEVLKVQVEAAEHQLEEIKSDLRALRKDVRQVLVATAENQGVWSGVRTGVRLTLLTVAAAAGAGVAQGLDWIKEVIK